MKYTSLQRDELQQDFLNHWRPRGMSGKKKKISRVSVGRCSKLEEGANRTRKGRDPQRTADGTQCLEHLDLSPVYTPWISLNIEVINLYFDKHYTKNNTDMASTVIICILAISMSLLAF